MCVGANSSAASLNKIRQYYSKGCLTPCVVYARVCVCVRADEHVVLCCMVHLQAKHKVVRSS